MKPTKTTLLDIARVVGLSPRAVSSALHGNGRVSEETRERVRQLARQMGYHPNIMARGLVAKRTYLMGVVFPYVAGSFYPEVLQGIEDRALQADYRVVICSAGWDAMIETQQISDLISRGVDGLILVPRSDASEDYAMLSRGIPYVQVFQRHPRLDGPYVRIQDEQGAYKAALHLIKTHKVRPYHFSGLRGVESEARLSGFKRALAECGYDFDARQCLYPSATAHWEDGYQALQNLARRKKVPRAIFAVNDYVALGAMRAAYELGLRIPQELAVVGYDDLNISHMQACIGLSTVRQPKELVGQLAVQILLDAIEGKPVSSVDLSPELVVRESCGARTPLE